MMLISLPKGKWCSSAVQQQGWSKYYFREPMSQIDFIERNLGRYIPSGLSLRISYQIGRAPKGNNRLPTTIFQGRAVKLRGVSADPNPQKVISECSMFSLHPFHRYHFRCQNHTSVASRTSSYAQIPVDTTWVVMFFGIY